jgi:hypothetical protein
VRWSGGEVNRTAEIGGHHVQRRSIARGLDGRNRRAPRRSLAARIIVDDGDRRAMGPVGLQGGGSGRRVVPSAHRRGTISGRCDRTMLSRRTPSRTGSHVHVWLSCALGPLGRLRTRRPRTTRGGVDRARPRVRVAGGRCAVPRRASDRGTHPSTTHGRRDVAPPAGHGWSARSCGGRCASRFGTGTPRASDSDAAGRRRPRRRRTLLPHASRSLPNRAGARPVLTND